MKAPRFGDLRSRPPGSCRASVSLALFAVLLPWPPPAAAQAPDTVFVHADSLLAPVDPHLFGSGAEIITGFSQPGLDPLLQATGATLLRLGGIAAEYYDWEGNGYQGSWYVDFTDTTVYQLPRAFGVDSLLRMSERVGMEPLLCVNAQLDDPAKAARLVEYCNGDASTPMGALRAARGHPAPYAVTYWGIGNESDLTGLTFPTAYGDWTLYRHFGVPFEDWSWRDSSFVTPEALGDLIVAYADSMRARSPIPLTVVAPCIGHDLAWIGPAVERAASRIDMVDVHYYPNNDTAADSSRYRDWLASMHTGTPYRPPFDDYVSAVRESVMVHGGGHDIRLAILEYNSGIITAPDATWWNYLNGLFVAEALGHLAAQGVRAAAIYSLYANTPAGGLPTYSIVRDDTLSRRAASRVLELYRGHFGTQAVRARSPSAEEGLELFASLDDAGDLRLVAVNKDLDHDRAALVRMTGFEAGAEARVWEIGGDAPIGAPWNGTTGIVERDPIAVQAGDFTHAFPRASVTAIEIPRAPATGVALPDGAEVPLLGVLPNPSPPGALPFRIVYRLERAAPVTLRVHDARGRTVRTLLQGSGTAGTHVVFWDGSTAGGRRTQSGVYFAVLSVDGRKPVARKFLLLR